MGKWKLLPQLYQRVKNKNIKGRNSLIIDISCQEKNSESNCFSFSLSFSFSFSFSLLFSLLRFLQQTGPACVRSRQKSVFELEKENAFGPSIATHRWTNSDAFNILLKPAFVCLCVCACVLLSVYILLGKCVHMCSYVCVWVLLSVYVSMNKFAYVHLPYADKHVCERSVLLENQTLKNVLL